jgi:hypothetical protein
MSKKYLPDSSTATIITNDLFLAAFLCTVGCTLDRIEKNARRRVSFVFVGERCRELREAYRTGPVHVDMRDFRENLNRLRDRLGETVTSQHPEERSAAHEHRIEQQSVSRLPSYAHA